MDTLLAFYNQQFPTTRSTLQVWPRAVFLAPGSLAPGSPTIRGGWDHLFLLFGLVESIAPDFFADRVFSGVATGDYNRDGVVDVGDYDRWRMTFGSENLAAADGNNDGIVERPTICVAKAFETAGGGTAVGVPEQRTLELATTLALTIMAIQMKRYPRESET